MYGTIAYGTVVLADYLLIELAIFMQCVIMFTAPMLLNQGNFEVHA